MAGYETVSDGYDRLRFRHKFRCPFAQRKGENPCPMKGECSKSPYGRVFHIKSQQVLNRKLNTSKNKIKLQNKIINRWNIMPL